VFPCGMSKVNFLFFIASKRDLLTPAFTRTHLFVRLVHVHDTRRMRRSPNISKALILSSSRLFNVQLSQPDVIAFHAIVFSRRTFVEMLTPRLPNAFQSCHGSSTFSNSVFDVLHTFCVICDNCSKICEGAHLF